jgi:predicted transcriptional regulator
MKRATIRISRNTPAALAEMAGSFINTWKGERSDTAVFDFESPKALFTVLTPKRWEMIEQLQALGEVSLRALARSLDRDVKRIHEDAAVLLEYGLIERTESGKLHVPYETIHTEFDIHAAA